MIEFILHILHRWKALSDDTKAVLTAAGSTITNLLLGFGKLLLAFFTGSPWFAINAVYYVLLGLARGSAVLFCVSIFQPQAPEKTQQRKRHACMFGGIFLILLGLCYLLISVRMYFREESITYAGYLIFGVVLLTFAKMGGAAHGLFFQRKSRDPVLTLIRKFSFADACVSLVTMRCALLMLSGASHAIQNSALFGGIVSFILIGLGSGSLFQAVKSKTLS